MYNNQFGQQYGYNAPAMPYMPSYQPQPTQQQAPSSNVSWVYVNGIDGARNQIVQPNQTAWMMDNNDPIIYVKTVDNMGTASLRAFRLTEVNTASAPSDAQQEYVTKTDLDDVITRLKSVEAFIGGINA